MTSHISLLRARKLWAAVSTPACWRALRLGVAPTIEHGEALDRFLFDGIVDVGANKGQFATFARAHFPASRITSFEPLDRPARIFEAVFSGDARTRLVRAAVAKDRGSLVMQITAADDSSSPLKVAPIQQQAFGTVAVEQREVRCGPLSDFLKNDDLGGRNLLKIDTQGFELEVLRGAESLLPRFHAIYCELSFVELYQGQPLASEVVAFLQSHAFNLSGIYNIASTDEHGMLQADMLFVRK